MIALVALGAGLGVVMRYLLGSTGLGLLAVGLGGWLGGLL